MYKGSTVAHAEHVDEAINVVIQYLRMKPMGFAHCACAEEGRLNTIVLITGK